MSTKSQDVTISSESLQKFVLPLSVGAALLAALVVSYNWSLAAVGAIPVLALSAAESELFILAVVFLLPLGWLLNTDFVVHDVVTGARILVAIGFVAGRLWRGNLHVAQLFS